jgi:hypothetical protein
MRSGSFESFTKRSYKTSEPAGHAPRLAHTHNHTHTHTHTIEKREREYAKRDVGCVKRSLCDRGVATTLLGSTKEVMRAPRVQYAICNDGSAACKYTIYIYICMCLCVYICVCVCVFVCTYIQH